MAAMKALVDSGYEVDSYGTGTSVNLPGPTPTQPNIYEFGTPYKDMYDQLKAADEALYTRNGVLNMLNRNLKVKKAPERWQDEKNKKYDICITYEERVYDALVEDMEENGSSTYGTLHVLGLDVRDNHKEAEIGANQTVDLVKMISEEGDEWEDKLDNVLDVFQKKTGKEVMHAVLFY